MFDSPSAASSCKHGPSDDAAGQKLPAGEGTEARRSLLGLCRHSLFGNVCAAVKSTEILIGGARVCNAATFALALTAIEDVFVLLRARQSCRSTTALLEVERDHAVYMAGEAVRRMGLMARIVRDVGEEAVYPLRVRFDLVLENLRRAFFL